MNYKIRNHNGKPVCSVHEIQNNESSHLKQAIL